LLEPAGFFFSPPSLTRLSFLSGERFLPFLPRAAVSHMRQFPTTCFLTLSQHLILFSHVAPLLPRGGACPSLKKAEENSRFAVGWTFFLSSFFVPYSPKLCCRSPDHFILSPGWRLKSLSFHPSFFHSRFSMSNPHGELMRLQEDWSSCSRSGPP